MPRGWGLSFMILPSVTDRRDITEHWSGMSNMFWWCDREKGVAGIGAVQILPFPDPGVGKLWAMVGAAVYEKNGNEGGHWGLNLVLKGIGSRILIDGNLALQRREICM